MDYDTFVDKGLRTQMLNDYTKIRCCLIFAVKHDRRHKARSFARGHLTQPSIESVYPGVVSICSIPLILLSAELNNLSIYQADVANTYLDVYTKVKIYFIAGKEFNTFRMEGHILIISKALYRLHTNDM